MANLRNIVGGRSAEYEKMRREAEVVALREMIEAADHLGANAVVGIDLDYENTTFGNSGSMLMVTASGTAVTAS